MSRRLKMVLPVPQEKLRYRQNVFSNPLFYYNTASAMMQSEKLILSEKS